METKEFIHKLDEPRILDAIAAAEKRSTGEIRVYVSHKERHEVMEFARKRFHELGMHKTRDRNAVLLYIVPRTQQFAVMGDVGIDQKCGPDFWTGIVAQMTPRMKAGQFTDALVGAIDDLGKALATHFPPSGDNPNELTNAIARD